VIRGARSPALTKGTALQMVSTLPDATLVEIAGGAHDLTSEQPAVLARVLERFLAA
jgi:pimeloyl-ACP methyl ester carboxylesterase